MIKRILVQINTDHRSSADEEALMNEFSGLVSKAFGEYSKSHSKFSSLRGSGFARNPLSGSDQRKDVIGHFDLAGKNLRLHIFVDKGLIQAYANDQKSPPVTVHV